MQALRNALVLASRSFISVIVLPETMETKAIREPRDADVLSVGACSLPP